MWERRRRGGRHTSKEFALVDTVLLGKANRAEESQDGGWVGGLRSRTCSWLPSETLPGPRPCPHGRESCIGRLCRGRHKTEHCLQRELWDLQQSRKASRDPQLQPWPYLSPVGQILAEIWRLALTKGVLVFVRWRCEVESGFIPWGWRARKLPSLCLSLRRSRPALEQRC